MTFFDICRIRTHGAGNSTNDSNEPKKEKQKTHQTESRFFLLRNDRVLGQPYRCSFWRSDTYAVTAVAMYECAKRTILLIVSAWRSSAQWSHMCYWQRLCANAWYAGRYQIKRETRQLSDRPTDVWTVIISILNVRLWLANCRWWASPDGFLFFAWLGEEIQSLSAKCNCGSYRADDGRLCRCILSHCHIATHGPHDTVVEVVDDKTFHIVFCGVSTECRFFTFSHKSSRDVHCAIKAVFPTLHSHFIDSSSNPAEDSWGW